MGLQNKPVILQGISAGAAFAVKLPKAFYEENFGGVIKIKGVLSGTPAGGVRLAAATAGGDLACT